MGVVDALAVIYNSIEEAAKLDKIAKLKASQKADLDKKTASSIDENNLPKEKPSASTRNSTKMIEELDKTTGLEPSKQDDLDKKTASSTDENNLPKGKPSLSLIAARVAKK